MKHNYSYLFLAFLIGSAVTMECIAADLAFPEKQYAEGMGYVKAEIIGQMEEQKLDNEKEGLINSVPQPAADPADPTVLYTFTGVSDDGLQGGGTRKEATSIHCTNIGGTEASVEVQVYNVSGGTPYTGTITIGAGVTTTFSTQNTTIYWDDIFLGGAGTGVISQGYGHVLSDSGNVICTAQFLDPLNSPPEVIVSLEMYRPDSSPRPSGLPSSSGDQMILYYFTGVSDDGEKGSINREDATSVHCTNIGSTEAEVEVQVFRSGGTTSYTGAITIWAGSTATFSTQNIQAYFDDIFLGGSPGTDAIYQGYGRILSNSKDIVCSAQVIDPKNSPPKYASKLPMFDRDGYPVNLRKRTVYYPIISN